MTQGHFLFSSPQTVAVIVVDVQCCFTSGGSLAVPGADAHYIQALELSVRRFKEAGFLILGTRDYHPEGHVSFASSHPGKAVFQTITLSDGRRQTLWPDHCVQTRGDSKALIDNNLFHEIIKKGGDPRFDCNSAFADDSGQKTELDAILKHEGIHTLIVFGLATDFCVKSTVLDAIAEGYRVLFIEDLSLGITEAGTREAIQQMHDAGVELIKRADDLNHCHIVSL